jgi:hypothetical protein
MFRLLYVAIFREYPYLTKYTGYYTALSVVNGKIQGVPVTTDPVA